MNYFLKNELIIYLIYSNTMGSYYSTSNVNMLITDSDNDDFFTKFLIKDDKYLCYSIKNTIPTIHKYLQKINKKKTNITCQQIDREKIMLNLFKKYIPELILDNKNSFNEIPEQLNSFQEILKKDLSNLKYTTEYKINITIDVSCYIFLEIITQLIYNNFIYPTEININFINNLQTSLLLNNKQKIDNKHINEILTGLYNTCKHANITLKYLLYDYCKSIKTTHLLEQPLYYSSTVMNILPIIKTRTNKRKTDINKLLFDYYTVYYDGKIPFYPIFLSLIIDNELEICKNILSIKDINTPPEFYLSGLDYYVFKKKIKPVNHFNNHIKKIILRDFM